MRIHMGLAVLLVLMIPAAVSAQTESFGVRAPDLALAASAPSTFSGMSVAAALGPRTSGLDPSYVRVRGVRGPYRPRAYSRRPAMVPLSLQLHLGLFNPVSEFSTGFDGGFRIGPQLSPFVNVGLAMDWWRRSDNKVIDLGTVHAPVGTAHEQLLVSQSSANLLPILFFIQVSGGEDLAVVPYGGVGMGYEWLFLTADDFVTGESFDQTFGGFGWQVWGGVGLPLDRQTRLNAEVYFNGCEVASDLDVFIEGYGRATVRDVIDMNGVGMRFGISHWF